MPGKRLHQAFKQNTSNQFQTMSTCKGKLETPEILGDKAFSKSNLLSNVFA
jgi:hypothetical protein